MERFQDARIPALVRQLPRVASRVTDEWALSHQPEAGDFLSLKPYPPLSTPEHIIRAAQEAAADPHSAPARGLFSLRSGIATRLEAECNAQIDPETEVLITNGGMNALHIVFLTLLEPGDEVIVPAPCFFLEGLVERFGARLVFVATDEEHHFVWDLDRIERAITKRSKILFLNTPVNPTGRVLTAEELESIGRIAETYNLCILSDESYDRLTYDGRKHVSPLALPGCRQRTILIRSFTKSYVMPSWRVGYVVADADLTELFLKMFEWTNLYANQVCQAAADAAIRGPQDWLHKAAPLLQANRDQLMAGLKAEPLSCIKPEGGPFIFLNVSSACASGDTFAELLFHRFGVPVTAGSAMQAPQHVRIPLGGTTEAIEELVRRLQKAIRHCQI